jgi:hypothetical protein
MGRCLKVSKSRFTGASFNSAHVHIHEQRLCCRMLHEKRRQCLQLDLARQPALPTYQQTAQIHAIGAKVQVWQVLGLASCVPAAQVEQPGHKHNSAMDISFKL